MTLLYLSSESEWHFALVLSAIAGGFLMQLVGSLTHFSIRKTGDKQKNKKLKAFLKKVESGEIPIE